MPKKPTEYHGLVQMQKNSYAHGAWSNPYSSCSVCDHHESPKTLYITCLFQSVFFISPCMSLKCVLSGPKEPEDLTTNIHLVAVHEALFSCPHPYPFPAAVHVQ